MECKKEKSNDVYIKVNTGMTKASFDTVCGIIGYLLFVAFILLSYKNKEWIQLVLNIIGAIYFLRMHSKAYAKLPEK